MEVPSSHAGKVLKVHIQSGQTVPIGSVLLTLETADVAAPPPPLQRRRSQQRRHRNAACTPPHPWLLPPLPSPRGSNPVLRSTACGARATARRRLAASAPFEGQADDGHLSRTGHSTLRARSASIFARLWARVKTAHYSRRCGRATCIGHRTLGGHHGRRHCGNDDDAHRHNGAQRNWPRHQLRPAMPTSPHQ